jgi:hypothetical protein
LRSGATASSRSRMITSAGRSRALASARVGSGQEQRAAARALGLVGGHGFPSRQAGLAVAGW